MCTIIIIKSCTNINACVPMKNKYLNLNLNLNYYVNYYATLLMPCIKQINYWFDLILITYWSEIDINPAKDECYILPPYLRHPFSSSFSTILPSIFPWSFKLPLFLNLHRSYFSCAFSFFSEPNFSFLPKLWHLLTFPSYGRKGGGCHFKHAVKVSVGVWVQSDLDLFNYQARIQI